MTDRMCFINLLTHSHTTANAAVIYKIANCHNVVTPHVRVVSSWHELHEDQKSTIVTNVDWHFKMYNYTLQL